MIAALQVDRMVPALHEPTLILASGAAVAIPPPRCPSAERAVRDALFARLRSLRCMPARGAHLAHSGGVVAYLTGTAGGTGVDLEWIRPRDVRSLARFAYSADEARAIEDAPEALRLQSFYDLWVLKEAAGKALGLDLFTALAQAQFRVEGGVITGELPGCHAWTAALYAPNPWLRVAIVATGRAPAAGCDSAWSPTCVEWHANADAWSPARWRRVAVSGA
jgi:hypothetical protein